MPLHENRDEMGVCVEPLDVAMSLSWRFEQFIYRAAAEREGRQNARSSAGDLDLTIYSLRKWLRLALKENPTILLLLFTPEGQLVHVDDLGTELRHLAPAIVSRRVQAPYLGWATSLPGPSRERVRHHQHLPRELPGSDVTTNQDKTLA